jgi:hypothetical protein
MAISGLDINREGLLGLGVPRAIKERRYGADSAY